MSLLIATTLLVGSWTMYVVMPHFPWPPMFNASPLNTSAEGDFAYMEEHLLRFQLFLANAAAAGFGLLALLLGGRRGFLLPLMLLILAVLASNYGLHGVGRAR